MCQETLNCEVGLKLNNVKIYKNRKKMIVIKTLIIHKLGDIIFN